MVRGVLATSFVNAHFSHPGGIEGRHRYYFMIGSVDSFERKLDEAQRELGLNASAHVPVKYAHEVGGTTGIWYCNMMTG